MNILSPNNINVHVKDNEEKKQFQVSKYATVGQLKEMIAEGNVQEANGKTLTYEGKEIKDESFVLNESALMKSSSLKPITFQFRMVSRSAGNPHYFMVLIYDQNGLVLYREYENGNYITANRCHGYIQGTYGGYNYNVTTKSDQPNWYGARLALRNNGSDRLRVQTGHFYHIRFS